MLLRLSFGVFDKVQYFLILKFLVVPLGQEVKRGDVIAVKKGFLGVKKILSPVEGVLEKLEENTGRLTIEKTEPVQKTFVSSKRKVINRVLGFGETEGELIFKKEVTMENLDESIKDKIILCPEISSVGAFFKASALGTRGLIVGMMSKNFFDKLEEATKGRSGMALLVLDAKETFEKIKKSVGKKVAIDNNKIKTI